ADMGCRLRSRKGTKLAPPRLRDTPPDRVAAVYRRPKILGLMMKLMPKSARAAFLCLALAPALAACGQAPQQAAPPPPAVTIAKPTKQTVTDYDEYVGRFVAVDMVEARARVSGYLDKIHFQDGELVKQGDLLFTVDR